MNSQHYASGSTRPTFPDDGKLHFYAMRFCPYAHRIRLILNIKEIPFHTININLTTKPEWLSDVYPSGKVPALTLTNEPGTPTIYESLIVADYLDEKYPQNQMHSTDPLVKAQDRLLLEQFSIISIPLYKIMVSPNGVPPPQSIDDLKSGLDMYEDELKQRNNSYFGGTSPGMVDFMIWPWFERIDMIKYLESDQFELNDNHYPTLLKWISLMKEQPAVKDAYLSGDVYANFFNVWRTGNPNYDILL